MNVSALFLFCGMCAQTSQSFFACRPWAAVISCCSGLITCILVAVFSFKESATRISRLLSDRRRTSAQESADWIEYVLRHGGARHLRPEVFNIPWYQFYLLDVIAFLVAVVTVVVLILRLVCRCVCRVCSRKRENKPKAD